ncbi:hypothetical protein NLI96_g79 [Meripilus lineatus]|uniref:Uncharacterized protein n=1 Tax=Meripilus lineatus TaxID=2056292 RepID=A0AAD5VIT1_9APHY|nr:hypothetical protein NLI96_g79 [Physisporinus lineatus]
MIIRQSVFTVNEDKQYVHQNVALRFNVSTFDHRDCGEIHTLRVSTWEKLGVYGPVMEGGGAREIPSITGEDGQIKKVWMCQRTGVHL